MPHLWYFAYGSNMQSATFCGRRGITFARAVAARAPGWQVVFDNPPIVPIGESHANLVAAPDGEAFGVAYAVSTAALEAIDLSEGVLIGNYVRRPVAVVPLDGSTAFEAFTLVSERRDATLQPSTRYMAMLIEGALEHGLPTAYVEFLRTIPAREPSAAARAFLPVMEGALAAMRPKS
jgi:cation transport regulator ChaC